MRKLTLPLLVLALLLSPLTISAPTVASAAPPGATILPMEVVAPQPTYDDARSVVVVPNVAGVEYTVDGVAAAPGEVTVTPAAPSGSLVTIVATRTSDGMQWTWTHQFPFIVTPNAPTFDDDQFIVKTPSHWGVSYWLVKADGVEQKLPSNTFNRLPELEGQQFTIEARTNNARQVLLRGTTSWTHTFPQKPVGPTFTDATATITIPAVPGIEYRIDGELVAAGDHTVDASTGVVDVTVTAVRTSDGQEFQWTHRFPQLLTPTTPKMSNSKMLVWVPGHMHVSFYAIVDGVETKLNSNSWNGSWEQFNGKTVTIEARANNTQVLLQGTTSWTFEFMDRQDTSLANGDEFNDDGIALDWNIYDDVVNKRSTSLDENMRIVKLDDGTSALEITTMRHCLANEGDPLTLDNANPEGTVCPEGTVTAYSSGNMNSPYDIEIPKSIETRVRLDSPHKGITFAVWAHNTARYCNWYEHEQGPSDAGELDLAELWSTSYAQFSTFAGCWYDSANHPWYAAAKPKIDVDLAGQWHTLRVEYDGRAIRYFVDGKPASGPFGEEITAEVYGVTKPDGSVDQEKMDRVMQAYDWRLVAGAKVPVTDGWAPFVRDSEPFPVQRDLVDYIRVEQWDRESLPTIVADDVAPVRLDQAGVATGTVSVPGATVRSEVQLADGTWSLSRTAAADADGNFEIPLTYGTGHAGDRTYRLSVTSEDGFWVSTLVDLTRIPTASNASVKPVGETTFVWGSTGLPGATVHTEVQLPGGTWSKSRVGTTDATGGYVLPLTYGVNEVGTYRYRVVVTTADGAVASKTFELTRIPSAATAGTKRIGLATNVWGATGLPGARVFTEVKLPSGAWSRSQIGTTDATGRYVLPLTYGANTVGTYTYRVGVDTPTGTVRSNPVTIQRVR